MSRVCLRACAKASFTREISRKVKVIVFAIKIALRKVFWKSKEG